MKENEDIMNDEEKIISLTQEIKDLNDLCSLFAKKLHAKGEVIALLVNKVKELGGDPEFYLSLDEKERRKLFEDKWNESVIKE